MQRASIWEWQIIPGHSLCGIPAGHNDCSLVRYQGHCKACVQFFVGARVKHCSPLTIINHEETFGHIVLAFF